MQNHRHLVSVYIVASVLTVGGGCRSHSLEIEPALTPQQRRIAMLNRLPTVKSVVVWPLPEFIQQRSAEGLKVTTAHYLIYTSLEDPLILRQVPVFLESAFGAYNQAIGQSLTTKKKLLVYMFNSREQWEDFTRHWAGKQARIYLQINLSRYVSAWTSLSYMYLANNKVLLKKSSIKSLGNCIPTSYMNLTNPLRYKDFNFLVGTTFSLLCTGCNISEFSEYRRFFVHP